ncbi:MAG: glycosyltransferase family 2 protein [Nanoarchaeota archaeon]
MAVVKGRVMKKNPMVSAVIAAYKEEIHLAGCVDSLLNQNYGNFEIIIVENGESNDKTYQIALDYQRRYPEKVRAYSLSGKQKGPGNAWNFGAKKAKGEIVMTCGADLRYGRDYVKKAIVPIVKGESIGVVHKEETCNNINNLWARAFFYKRQSMHKNSLSRVFSLIRKDYLLKIPFNSELGYADDQTIYRTNGGEFPCIDLEVYHTNPASFKDNWEHSVWVGNSIRPWPIVFILPIFPLYSIYKTVKHLMIDFYVPFIFFLPFYYSIRYFAYLTSAFRKIISGKT